MKNDRLAIMLLACATATAACASAYAQNSLPRCETANYDSMKKLFTVMNPVPGTVIQECLLTVHSAAAASGAQYPEPFVVEGYYDVIMSGGGGGGGAGGKDGGGGGGAGAAPFKTILHLFPGAYKLTLGAGGEGGLPGKVTRSGGSTSLTNADTGEHIAGFQGASNWRPPSQPPGTGRGGLATWGGSNGGDGTKLSPAALAEAQRGGMLQVAEYSGTPGQAGSETDRSVRTARSGGVLQISGYTGAPGQVGGEPIQIARTDDGRVVQMFAGGGGGASFGNGGAGQPADSHRAAGMGELGGGGGGGRGGTKIAEPGARGGHGFIQLSTYVEPAQVIAAAPAAAAPDLAPSSPATATPEPAATPRMAPAAPAASRPARSDRN